MKSVRVHFIANFTLFIACFISVACKSDSGLKPATSSGGSTKGTTDINPICQKGETGPAGAPGVSLLFGGLSKGLIVTNFNEQFSGSTVSISYTALALEDSAHRISMSYSSSLKATLTANGLNGLDSGAPQSEQWYYLWVISDGTNLASLVSLSPTSPAVPSGFIYRALVGAAYNQSPDGFPLFYQQGTHVRFKKPVQVQSGVSTAVKSISLSTQVPPMATGVNVILRCSPAGGTSYSGTCYVGIDGSTDGLLQAYYRYNSTTGDFGIDTVTDSLPLVAPQTIYFWATQGNGSGQISVTGFSL